MIEGILRQQQSAGFDVAEVWSIDMPFSGGTPLLNAQGYLYGQSTNSCGLVLPI